MSHASNEKLKTTPDGQIKIKLEHLNLKQEKTDEKGLVSIEDSIDASIQQLVDYLHKSGGKLITATRNNGYNMRTNRVTNRKQKWEEKQLYGRFRRLISDISHRKTWKWLRKRNLKRLNDLPWIYTWFISETLCNNGFPLSVLLTVITNEITEFYTGISAKFSCAFMSSLTGWNLRVICSTNYANCMEVLFFIQYYNKQVDLFGNSSYCKVKKAPTLKTERKLLHILGKNTDLIPKTKYRQLIQHYC